ncbi:DEAD/DEAH box helicase [Salinispira pacifica]|uniref:DEAD-box ATP-dependent RNA helicase RhpA n=1 Tax=Salinispira pacifica TaxID=1307761 RepID=V5WHU2_9SPIO|nr:DEAD/DEAH box helicase [Salinispira pacifica]AHC15397.1 ATP-dependent RNA helicase RhlE [Salinispira pacifica]
MKFQNLGLMPELCKAVRERGYSEATPIQAATIPAILEGKDVLGGAQTGTGKTAAFALPMLQRLGTHKSEAPRALILTPTRELADQVAESFIAYGSHLELKVLKIYGGVSMNPQKKSLARGVDIIVATPGRLRDHLGQKTIDLSKIDILVLDEADRMLDMGFINDIKAILNELKKPVRQTLMFSATYGKDVEKLALKILNDPVRADVAPRNSAGSDVRQIAYNVGRVKRVDLLIHLIQSGSWYQVLVFVRTKHGADRLAKKLNKADIPSMAIHGDKKQGARTRALEKFKKGDLQALIATDIAARGIDLTDLSHVVNFDLPQQAEDYVHRIGRTGRAGKSGDAISFITEEDGKKLADIEHLLKSSIPGKTVPGFEPLQAAAKPGVNDRRTSGATSPAGRRKKPAGRSSRGKGPAGSGGSAHKESTLGGSGRRRPTNNSDGGRQSNRGRGKPNRGR